MVPIAKPSSTAKSTMSGGRIARPNAMANESATAARPAPKPIPGLDGASTQPSEPVTAITANSPRVCMMTSSIVSDDGARCICASCSGVAFLGSAIMNGLLNAGFEDFNCAMSLPTVVESVRFLKDLAPYTLPMPPNPEPPAALDAQTRWLTAAEQTAWRAFLDAVQLLNTEVEAQLQRDSAISHADYEILVRLSE